MFGKNKNAKVDSEYKNHEQKIMTEAKLRAKEKAIEDFDNETISVTRDTVVRFMVEFSVNAEETDFKTKETKELFTFLNKKIDD